MVAKRSKFRPRGSRKRKELLRRIVRIGKAMPLIFPSRNRFLEELEPEGK